MKCLRLADSVLFVFFVLFGIRHRNTDFFNFGHPHYPRNRLINDINNGVLNDWPGFLWLSCAYSFLSTWTAFFDFLRRGSFGSNFACFSACPGPARFRLCDGLFPTSHCNPPWAQRTSAKDSQFSKRPKGGSGWGRRSRFRAATGKKTTSNSLRNATFLSSLDALSLAWCSRADTDRMRIRIASRNVRSNVAIGDT
jgi:hypothetical protein